MCEDWYPRVRLDTQAEPPRGTNIYRSIPEMVEFAPLDPAGGGLRSLALGRVLISLRGESSEFAGLQSYVKTGRWKRAEEPPGEPDAQGVMYIDLPPGGESPVFVSAEPRFLWHEESSSLRITLAEGMALLLRVADCVSVGVDRDGRLTDIWLLELDLEVR